MQSAQLKTLLLVCLVAGCSPTLGVHSLNHLRVDGPIHTASTVRVEPPALGPADPVLPVPVTPGPLQPGPRIAVVDLDGLILNTPFSGPYSAGENPVSAFREKLDAIASDPLVRAVVLRINSPGGSVTATDILWHDLVAFRKRTGLPVVACLLDVGAGGAYYIASGADVIIAHPTSLVGGIGVILNVYNMQDLMAQFNILGQPIKSGDLIDMGNSSRKLPDDAKALLQQMADEYHERFIEIVRSARPRVDILEQSNFDGRVFTASSALQHHLIDRVGYLDDAIALAQEAASTPFAQAVLYRRKSDTPLSVYATTPNTPLQATAWPINIPGLDRSRLPAFLYLWQPEASISRVSGQ